MPNYDIPNYEMPNYDPPYVTKSDHQISSHRGQHALTTTTHRAESSVREPELLCPGSLPPGHKGPRAPAAAARFF